MGHGKYVRHGHHEKFVAVGLGARFFSDLSQEVQGISNMCAATRAPITPHSTLDSADPIQLFHGALLGICRSVMHAGHWQQVPMAQKKMRTKKIY